MLSWSSLDSQVESPTTPIGSELLRRFVLTEPSPSASKFTMITLSPREADLVFFLEADGTTKWQHLPGPFVMRIFRGDLQSALTTLMYVDLVSFDLRLLQLLFGNVDVWNQLTIPLSSLEEILSQAVSLRGLGMLGTASNNDTDRNSALQVSDRGAE